MPWRRMLTALHVGRLQVKLVWLVLISSLPAFVLLFWFGLMDREHAMERANEELASAAQLAGVDQEKRLEAVRHSLVLLSRLRALRGGDIQTCSSLLEDLRYRQSLFYNLGVFNTDGRLQCSAISLPTVANVSNSAWFRRTLETQQFTASGYVLSRLSGLHTMQFAVPLYDISDHVSGVVFGSWELMAHNKSLAGLRLGADKRLILVDRSGVILGSLPSNPLAIGQVITDQRQLDAIRAGAVGQKAFNDARGGTGATLSKIASVDVGDMRIMYVIASTDREAVVSPINRRAYFNLAALLGTVALVMFAAWRLGGRWVTKRAATVASVAEQIGTGQFRARTGFKSSRDEFDQLGYAIDRMAESLEKREVDLHATSRQLSEAQRIAKLGHWELDVPSNRRWWSNGALEMFSIKAAEDSFDAYLEWVHPDDRDALAAANDRMMTTGAMIDMEYRTIGADGKLRWIHAVSEGVRDENGCVVKLAGVIQDITDHKEAVAALVAGEERYRQLFRVNPQPIAIYDIESMLYIAANDVFCQQYGYTEDELKSVRSIDLTAAELREELHAIIRALPIGVPTTGQTRNIRKDGGFIDVQTTRIRTVIGGRDVVIVSPINITDRIRIDNALKSSEARYRVLFEGNPLPLWLYDPESLKFLDINLTACAHYGYTREEFLAMTMRDIRPVEDVAALEQRIPRDGAAVVGSGPWRHLRKDGTVIMVEINNHEVLLNGRRARLVCPIDVTEKVNAQEEVRQMNLQLERKVAARTEELSRSLALQQSLFDNVPEIVWLADLTGGITFANRIWFEEINAAAEDWKGDGWAKWLHPDDLARVTLEWSEAAPVKDSFDIEYRLLHRDGEYHDYQVIARKVFDTSAAPICWVGICTDVTDARRREEALKFANQELEAFCSSVSHDLRAPLRTISGFSERLKSEVGEGLDEAGRHYLDRIRAGAANMSELIDDLLSLAQLTRGNIALGDVNLSALARQVFEEVRQTEPDHPAEIVIRENMHAHGDARLLKALLVNLIGNALKFSGKRDVSLIEIGETARAGESPMFFVRDNGAGFDPAYASKMFGVFQRLHSASEFPGTGIGLATVQRIVHRHGGRVRAEGAVNQGATIYFSLRRD